MATLPPFIEAPILGLWLGVEFTDADIAKAEAIIASASTLVRTETGRAWVDADGNLVTAASFDAHGDEILEALRDVTQSVAGRVWRNPGGITSETTGPFTVTYNVEQAQGLYITDTEGRQLAQAVAWATGSAARGVWTLGTTRGDLETARGYGTDDIFLDTIPSGDPIVWAGPDGF